MSDDVVAWVDEAEMDEADVDEVEDNGVDEVSVAPGLGLESVPRVASGIGVRGLRLVVVESSVCVPLKEGRVMDTVIVSLPSVTVSSALVIEKVLPVIASRLEQADPVVIVVVSVVAVTPQPVWVEH